MDCWKLFPERQHCTSCEEELEAGYGACIHMFFDNSSCDCCCSCGNEVKEKQWEEAKKKYEENQKEPG